MLLRSLQKHFLACVLIALVVAIATPQLVNAFFAFDIGVMFLQFFARITGWAGVLLNLAIMELVFDMGNKVQNQFGASLENSWSVIRDFMNLAFIFALVYIGFKVILDGGTSAARNLLPRLIIAALLINFSLFFTKVIIDFTNLAAVSIYTSVGFAPVASFDESSENDVLVNIGVSGAFMQVMGLKDLLAPRRDSEGAREQYAHVLQSCGSSANTDQLNCYVTGFVFFLVTCIFFMIAAYAFFVGAFMLVTRFIVLIILMILSPLMFVGYIFPQAQRFASRWWGTFLNAAFFAPAYLLMLYIGYMIASRAGVMTAHHTFFEAANGSFVMVDVILNFIIVSGFLIAAVSVAKQMSFYGSSATLGVANNIKNRGKRALYRTGGFAAGAGVAAAGYAGRQSIGKLGQKTAEGDNAYGERLRLQAQGKGVNAWLARRQLDLANKAAGASFDGRALLGKDAQKNFGGPQKGGYAQKIKDREKAAKQVAERYGGNDAQIYTAYGVEGVKKSYDKLVSERKKKEQEFATTGRPGALAEIKALSKSIKELESGNLSSHKEMIKGDFTKEHGSTWEEHQRMGGKMEKQAWDNELNKLNLKLSNVDTSEAGKIFVDARKNEKGYGARRYARSEEVRYDTNKFTRAVGMLVSDGYARKKGAEAVYKANSSKDVATRFKELAKEAAKEEEPTPAPAPAATP